MKLPKPTLNMANLINESAEAEKFREAKYAAKKNVFQKKSKKLSKKHRYPQP